MDDKMDISVIIPAFNEERSIGRVIEFVLGEMHKIKNIKYEIIVVNDASTDLTQEIVSKYNVEIINSLINKGYGASIKSALRQAKGFYVLTIDADSQHANVDISKFYETIVKNNYDMVVGERAKNSDVSFIRYIGKKIIRFCVNMLARAKIYDFNSGFRIFKREIALKYMHLFPNGFSLTSTMTVAFFKDGYNVFYLPISIEKRDGKSTVSFYDAFITITSLFRLIMIFSPLNVFMPISLFAFILGSSILFFDLRNANIQDVTVLILLFSILTFLFGLVVDQIAQIRRDLKSF